MFKFILPGVCVYYKMVHVACVLSIIIIKSVVLDAIGFVNQCFSIIFEFITCIRFKKKEDSDNTPIARDDQNNNKQTHI